MLTISVKNFGPIAEGSVDLKPLTIFVGPSNTGKSYMATAVYAVMRGFQRRYQVPYTFQATRMPPEGENSEAEELKFDQFPKAVSESVISDVHHLILGLKEGALSELTANYGEKLPFLRRTAEATDFQINISRINPNLQLDIRLGNDDASSIQFDISAISSSREGIDILSFDETSKDLFTGQEYTINALRIHQQGIRNWLLYSASSQVFSEFPPHTFYLPAARSGVLQAHKVIASSLVSQSYRVGIEPMNIPPLPGITANFLSALIGIDARKAEEDSSAEFHGAIQYIEDEVLKGLVGLDQSGGLPFPDIVYYQDSTGSHPERYHIQETSSMVSELAPLILFLKYLVRPGDLLILEEPESHLHPSGQRQLARGIVRLVNAGVQVLITTHSDIIISQINNLLALNQASPELIADGEFEPEDFLREDQVSAYLFQNSKELGGSTVKRLEIDSDTGIDEDEFADVFEAIYNESIALQRDRG